MKFKIALSFLLSLCCLKGQSQANNQTTFLDTSLAKKITISGICLCQTTLLDLKKLSNDFKPIEVEEMDLGEKCISQDSRFENGKGYYSDNFPGMIFQKTGTSDEVSKIRLTKNFRGNLPDGTPIDLRNLRLKDVFNIYPKLKDTWGSRGCSDYWKFANDTLFFYVKIDTTKHPQFPIDEAFYYDKPIEAVDLLISCYRIFEKKERYKQLFNDPVFFIDSANVTRLEMQEYQPTDIAVVTVYKDINAIKLVGEQGKFGAVYVETKKFSRNRYWNYFKTKSADYSKSFPTPQSDSSVIYILNDTVLKTNFEGDLSGINDKNFIDLKIIDKQKLNNDYNISDKIFGVVIRTKPKEKKD
ncbi:hypothetical protein ACX0G7_27105 [Flavitalea antarctica]